MTQNIRWKQRFENFKKAFLFLDKATQRKEYDELQAAGLVQSFEFTFKLGWKTMKDHLEFVGISKNSPRETIKEAFSAGIIQDGHLWVEMLDKRNELTHTYNDEQARKAINLICHHYFPGIKQVYQALENKL